MLPRASWKSWEPRFGFPVFKGVACYVSFSIRPDFKPLDYKKLARDARASLRSGFKAAVRFAGETAPLLIFCRDARLRFRVLITTRDGVLLGEEQIPGSYPPGGSVDIDVSAVIARLGLLDDDYLAIMVMSNGRHDALRSSPGSYSMTYATARTFTTYRTGGFTRILNDPKKKSHFGFRGINPVTLADDRAMSSIFLINHSSDPSYDTTVTPRVVLLRADGATREATFGPIPAFGGRERRINDLFGSDVGAFLAPFGGRGTTITTCPGVTLASLHLLRSRDGSSFSIEHSRPTHAYLLNGVPDTHYA